MLPTVTLKCDAFIYLFFESLFDFFLQAEGLYSSSLSLVCFYFHSHSESVCGKILPIFVEAAASVAMGRRARDQNCEISASVSRVEGTIGISSEFVETDSRNGGLPGKEMDLQRRTRKLRDEEAVSAFTTPKEGKLATAGECKQRNKQSNSNRPQGRQRPGPGIRSMGDEGAGAGGSIDNFSGDATAGDRKVNRPTRKGSDAGTQRSSIFHSLAFLGARMDCKQKDVIAADGGGGVEGGENGGNQPNSVSPGTTQPDCLFDDAIEGESSVQEENGLMGEEFLRIIQSPQMRGLGGELQAEAARRARREKVQAAENRQQRSLRRLQLVEEMFAKALERRMKAMQRIAADPPADRLIGNHAMQHIPVSMLPGELRRTALAFMDGVTRDVNSTAGTVPFAADKNEISRKKFFLTDVDEAAAEEQKKEPTDAINAGVGLQQTEEEKTNFPNLNGMEEEELLRKWRELGYTAVYLPATGRLVYPGESSVRNRSSKKPYVPDRWMSRQPLPPVHLVQRKLPPEFILLHGGTKSVGRRRPLPVVCRSGKN
ncbi:hypothetical protein C3747_96g60 [Trypanosoma cruzi]|uniref:Uncharacterized protein n=2 Tax=Trypanosoma cruzi TaxID=5693 RepID=Q4DHR1_TRYCC|nr:hypothetical protein, conserved [Trypanosoma cruzi]EAN92054.1 hypothetical protein, conserved [Trypanosoma cruzi]PWV07921.1 hypothetical protein C3747_96g60 [Trypanosoma cruzi]|eukprot:XP_813905.1 hypothetical protein [Trypanosoma cruzi strain CL Brener]